MDSALIISAFIAGILTFLAPCTLPLLPGYLGLISGVTSEDLTHRSGTIRARGKVFINGLSYVIGFSLVFIFLGSLFGLGGAALFKYRIWLSRIGGIFVVLFGLFMIGVIRLPFLSSQKALPIARVIRPGNPLSSFIFGSAFAFGWTPCIGPILGAVLTLAASSATVGQGAFLLAIFSMGLALPFLAVALSIESAHRYLPVIARYLRAISFIGGIFLVLLGILLITDSFNLWVSYAYRLFEFINYEKLLNYL